MDILQLREFKTIAELQSVSRAAEVLHVAQPSLSRTIKTLEAELNISLFERTGRNICLNENGKILLKYTNDILHSIDQMKMELSHANFQNLSVMPINFYAASALMPYIARQFHSRYPHIKLQLFSQKSSDLKRGALGRIAVFASARQEENENATLLLTERILAAVPAAHPLSVRKELCLKELQKENIISCTRGVAIRDNMDYFFRQEGVKQTIFLECNEPSAIRDLVYSGFGISFFPEYSWGRLLSDANVVYIPIVHPACRRFLYITWGGAREKKPESVQVFEGFLSDFFAQAGGSAFPVLPLQKL